MIIDVIRGFFMALADSVPGVSGGTIAFLMGFFDKFINSLNYLLKGTKEEKIKSIKFLAKLFLGWIIGMGLAVTILANLFDKEINTLYLNFSDPWPKARHAKRRLTSPIFLEKYDKIFKSNAEIIMKTDNNPLFEYSKESLENFGYQIKSITRDLYQEDVSQNIKTEYEKKFVKLGVKINRLAAVKQSKSNKNPKKTL